MNQKDIDLIISLHKHLSLSKVAKELYISQPALTRRLALMEERFDCQLIVRHSAGVTFTSQGEKLYQHALKLHQDLLYLIDDMKSQSNEISGTLQIGVSNIYAHYQLPKILKEFSQLYPLVDFKIISDRSSNTFNRLKNSEISLAIVRDTYAWSHARIDLSEEPVCLAYQQPVSLEELSELNYIQYVTDSSFQSQIDEWINHHLLTEPKISVSTSSISTCLELIKNGLGWSIVSEIGLRDFKGFKTNLVDKHQNPLIRTTSLYFREESLKLNPVKAFVDFLGEFHR